MSAAIKMHHHVEVHINMDFNMVVHFYSGGHVV